MKKQAGLWIDHSKAVVVLVSDKGEQAGVLVVQAEKQRHHADESPRHGRYEAQKVPADDRRQRIVTAHRNGFYDAVIACLGAAEAIMICGPGEAKGELKKRLVKKIYGSRIVAVETAGKLSNYQVAAKVRHYFAA
jgi:hypothetical protein